MKNISIKINLRILYLYDKNYFKIKNNLYLF